MMMTVTLEDEDVAGAMLGAGVARTESGAVVVATGARVGARVGWTTLHVAFESNLRTESGMGHAKMFSFTILWRAWSNSRVIHSFIFK